MLYSVKKFTYKTVRDPRDPKKTMRMRQCTTIKSGVTWNEAKEMRRKDRSLVIFEGNAGPEDGNQFMN